MDFWVEERKTKHVNNIAERTAFLSLLRERERERERELTEQELAEVPVVTHCGVLLAVLVASITNENFSS